MRTLPFYKYGGPAWWVKLVFALLLIFVHGSAFSQRWPFELWHEGKIIRDIGDTLKGSIRYNLERNIVEYSPDDRTVTVFTPRKVLFFEIFDNTVHRYRQFFALPYAEGGSYETPMFFELLTEGKITLLSKEAVEVRSDPRFYGGFYNRQVLVYSYFIMNDKGKIVPFSGKRNDLRDLMGRHADAVDDYIRVNRLRVEERADLARAVAYYNSLQPTS